MESLSQPNMPDLPAEDTGDVTRIPPGPVDFSDPDEMFPPTERTILDQSWFEDGDERV